jgi:hypothetical protein
MDFAGPNHPQQCLDAALNVESVGIEAGVAAVNKRVGPYYATAPVSERDPERLGRLLRVIKKSAIEFPQRSKSVVEFWQIFYRYLYAKAFHVSRPIYAFAS